MNKHNTGNPRSDQKVYTPECSNRKPNKTDAG